MHRWFLLLLIALLPLRGWVGDALAGEMLAQHVVAAQPAAGGGEQLATSAHGEGRQAHHDCTEHSHAPAAPEQAGEPSQDAAACAACASCQVCSSVAMAWTVTLGPLPVMMAVRPGSGSPRFASVDPARDLRPPIA